MKYKTTEELETYIKALYKHSKRKLLEIRIFKHLVILLLLFSIPFTVQAQKAPLAEKLSELLLNSPNWCINISNSFTAYKEKAIFVDIRSVSAYEKKHIPGSLNIPVDNLSQLLLEHPGILPKKQPIYLICCQKDRNVTYALLPLRMAGYEAYAVVGGGVTAWEKLQRPVAEGKAQPLQEKYNTKLKPTEITALASLNPTFHMMKAGRSYTIANKALEKLLADGKKILTIEINENKKTLPYVEYAISLEKLPTAGFLRNISKDTLICLVGKDDKQLVLGMLTLRTFGYNAIIAVEE